MKAELERIWREEPLAFPLNITGWIDKNKKYASRYKQQFSKLLTAVKRRKVNPLKRIYNIWRKRS